MTDPIPLYAALDGAAFPNLPAQLERLGCRAECLFLGDLPPDVTAASPWLADLTSENGGDAARKWFLDGADAEAWGLLVRGRGPYPALRLHLRGLNLIRIPGDREVLFRWYDPRILPAVLTVLEPDQLARVYGPVDSFALVEPGGCVTELALRPPPGAVPARGLLTLDADQMAALEARLQHDLLPRELAEWLRIYLPGTVADLPETELFRRIRSGIERAAGWGITSADGASKFVRRQFVISPRFDLLPRIAAILSEPGLPEDEKLRRLDSRDLAPLWSKAAMLGNHWE